MDINFKILQSKYFNEIFFLNIYIFLNIYFLIFALKNFKINIQLLIVPTASPEYTEKRLTGLGFLPVKEVVEFLEGTRRGCEGGHLGGPGAGGVVVGQLATERSLEHELIVTRL